MSKALCIWAIGVLTGLGLLTAPASGETLLPAGDARGAWVIRQKVPGKYDVVVKPAGEKWQRVASGFTGLPAAAVALDSQLHVLLSDGDYLTFDMETGKPTAGLSLNPLRWSARARILAACASGPLARVQGAQTIVAVLAAEPGARSVPASAPAATQPRSSQGLALFALQGGRWTYLEDVPTPPPAPGQHVLAACCEGQLYLLLFTPGQTTHMLVRDRSGTWLPPRDMRALLPPGTSPLALMSVRDSLLLARLEVNSPAATRPQTGEVSLIAIEKDLKASAPRTIALPGQNVSSAVQAVGYANGLALVWPELPAPRFAPCDPIGRVQNVETIDAFAQVPDDGQAAEAWKYFLYFLFALFLLCTFLRMRQPRVLFSLPPGVRPARLPRRALACLIDLIPFSILGYELFPFPLPEGTIGPAEFVEFMNHQVADLNATLAVISTFALHGAYCLAMETHFGATLGKRLFGLRVVGPGGQKVKFYEVLYRTILRVLELGTVGLIMAIACILMTRYRQRAGDLLAQTAVVEGAPTPSPTPPPLPPDTTGTPPPDNRQG